MNIQMFLLRKYDFFSCVPDMKGNYGFPAWKSLNHYGKTLAKKNRGGYIIVEITFRFPPFRTSNPDRLNQPAL